MPPSMLMPAQAGDILAGSLSGSDKNHFIDARRLAAWSKAHGSVRPSTTTAATAATAQAQPTEGKGYRAPQHETAHILQSIPPRAPSRSSRSSILSYTLYTATTTRLASYTASNGSRDLLHRAESDSKSAKVDVDDEWLTSEAKAQGMWKLGVSLLKAKQLEGHLPASVERRVALARMTEELLSNPTSDQAVTKVESGDVQSSAEVDALIALKPLTSPDTTTLYHSTATHAAASGRSSTSVAQSLIDLKFGKTTDGEASAPLPDNDVKPSQADLARQSETVFELGAPTASTSEITATPHMDYRIVRGQAMRTRAKDIYATSILPSTSTTWCRRHRISSCTVCTAVFASKIDKRRANIPGQGLSRVVEGKKRLVDLVPQFLALSSSLLRDTRERANGTDLDDSVDDYLRPDASSAVEINVTAAWYSLLHSLLIQACLEGFLVDGWTGTTAIEVLFGVGCGVWEGRGWATRRPESTKTESRPAISNNGMEVDDDESGSDSESDDEEAEAEAEREREKAKLVEAAQTLFGSRDVAQADFERSMRDRIHEFLNVPTSGTLESHLLALNAKYPLSSFEADMFDFIESITRLLGKPTLAKLDHSAASSGQISASNGAGDPYALSRYFARAEESRLPSPQPWEPESVAAGKRRRMD